MRVVGNADSFPRQWFVDGFDNPEPDKRNMVARCRSPWFRITFKWFLHVMSLFSNGSMAAAFMFLSLTVVAYAGSAG